MIEKVIAAFFVSCEFPPGIEKQKDFNPPKIRFCHPFENYDFPPGCVAYGVGKKKGCQWMQIWFSCLYDSDLRKIDAQIRCNKSSLGIFRPEEKEDYMEVRKEDQRDPDEKVVEIEIERLRDFKNHPFKVQADSQMKELQESIKKYGILNPLIVRPRPEGFYEIISGHRRKYAAQQLKYTKVPVIIRYMLEEDAIISMVDANLQRERISPSEKAFAYKMKYDVLKRKAGRRKCSQVDYLTGKKSVEVISEECGDSPKQVQRYLKLTKLIPELLEKVDDEIMGFTIAVELASLTEKNQKTVLDAMESTLGTPNLSQAIRIKKLQENGVFSKEKIEELLSEIKQKDIDRVVFKNEQLYRYFPSYYTAEQMKREILTLLKINMTFE